MFSISVKGIYGLAALYTLATSYSRNHIQIREIAEAHKIPQHYLEQLLILLKKGGIVKSFRGNQGGYALARNPQQIRVLDILQCLEGTLQVVSPEHNTNVFHFFWNGLENSIKQELELTLQDLVMLKQKAEQQISYSI